MYLKILDNDLAVLRCSVDRSLNALKELGFTEGNSEPIVDVLEKYLKENNVRIQYWDLGEDIVALHLHEPNTGHFIVINESYQHVENAATRKMAVRKLFCHELAHVVLDHAPSYILPANATATMQKLHAALMQCVRDQAFHGRTEDDAEIFSGAIAFWPQTKFLEQFIRSKADFRLMANQYKMPVDCAVKWALLSLDAFPMHYLKHNETTPEVEDCYIPTSHAVFPWQFQTGAVFDDSRTVAHKCRINKADESGLTRAENPGGSANYVCHVYFEKAGAMPKRTDDKIVIAGFHENTFNAICKWAADVEKIPLSSGT